MNWDDARIFLAFAREGSFGAAAKRLGVQHSTISRRIHAMESNLAAPLVERSAHGYVLTGTGKDLRASALRMEQELLAFETASAGQSDVASGELKVSAIANMASSLLMPIFARFSEAHPKIILRVDVTNDSVRLSERDADIALRQTNAPAETLIGTRLATVSSAVYGSIRYCEEVRQGKAVERWIGVDCCDYHRNWTKDAYPAADHAFCVDETSVTAAALREGLGVGYLPCFMGDSDPALTRFRAPEKKHDLGLWCLYHRDLRDTKRVSLFCEHIRKEIKQIAPIFEGSQ
ncbi:LysR family transcriptional regulator [Yoonia sp. I 8.24]|uniref:LysR family transcriptional regulator n=1 Tax=Yoonia sp. I 8.24 TaxID=1537229 RepID=UPI001EDFAB06|nr:LysR family transcriptional regulator [Yoonia sp. I 8.24]MCG3267263.1 LysR family transcriptional regulator [Yoonia sp. I 8.24]